MKQLFYAKAIRIKRVVWSDEKGVGRDSQQSNISRNPPPPQPTSVILTIEDNFKIPWKFPILGL